MTGIPAVVELAPVAIGRGGYPSSKQQDGFPIKNVGNDKRRGMWGITRGGACRE
jgi:hypothetical protein